MLFHPASPAAPHHNTTPTNHHRCNSSPATTTLPPTRTTVLPCRRPTAPPPRPLQLEPQPLTISFCYHLVADHIQFRLRWYRFSVWDWMTISGMFSLLRSCYHHDLFVVVHSPSVHLGSDLQWLLAADLLAGSMSSKSRSSSTDRFLVFRLFVFMGGSSSSLREG